MEVESSRNKRDELLSELQTARAVDKVVNKRLKKKLREYLDSCEGSSSEIDNELIRIYFTGGLVVGDVTVNLSKSELIIDMLTAFKWIINCLHGDPIRSTQYLSKLSFFPLSTFNSLFILIYSSTKFVFRHITS